MSKGVNRTEEARRPATGPLGLRPRGDPSPGCSRTICLQEPKHRPHRTDPGRTASASGAQHDLGLGTRGSRCHSFGPQVRHLPESGPARTYLRRAASLHGTHALEPLRAPSGAGLLPGNSVCPHPAPTSVQATPSGGNSPEGWSAPARASHRPVSLEAWPIRCGEGLLSPPRPRGPSAWAGTGRARLPAGPRSGGAGTLRVNLPRKRLRPRGSLYSPPLPSLEHAWR